MPRSAISAFEHNGMEEEDGELMNDSAPSRGSNARTLTNMSIKNRVTPHSGRYGEQYLTWRP